MSDRRSILPWAVAAGAVAALILVVSFILMSDRDTDPAPNSADIAFAQDMTHHHSQAVLMSMVMLERLPPDEVRALAQQIALTQQQEIGVMQGWLLLWKEDTRPGTGADHHAMRGMASDDEIERLRNDPVASARPLFLRLMRSHHVAGIEMARAAKAEVALPASRDLATAMEQAQTLEIAQIDALLPAR